MARQGNRKERLSYRRGQSAAVVAPIAMESHVQENLELATPQSAVSSAMTSTTHSTSITDDEQESEVEVYKPFPFLLLPSEIRNRIYDIAFSNCPPVLDLDPTVFHLLLRARILSLISVSRQIHNEASHRFFSTHTFRIFPTFAGKHFKTKRPMLARIPPRYRASIATLELRLGPGWNNPPRGWIVNDALGLHDCERVRVLKVFVECDPSDPVFAGFRKSEDFYEKFTCELLNSILEEIPTIQVVEFDAWKSVNKTGNMVTALRGIAAKYNKVIGWGPERGWDRASGQEWLDGAFVQAFDAKLNIAITVSG